MEKYSIKRVVWTHPVYFLAFGFGSGLLPFVPGTFGTLMAIPFYLMLKILQWQAYLVISLLAFGVGVWLCDKTERKIGIPDYSGIVWDEMVGFWVTMLFAPDGWYWIFLGFVLFRLFDIIKPWPISWLNKNVHGGFGIMLDDLVAGFFACACLQLMALIIT